jgi:hypothetical protein
MFADRRIGRQRPWRLLGPALLTFQLPRPLLPLLSGLALLFEFRVALSQLLVRFVELLLELAALVRFVFPAQPKKPRHDSPRGLEIQPWFRP